MTIFNATTNKHKMEEVSDCCGASAVMNSDDIGICPECKEHCEYVEIDD